MTDLIIVLVVALILGAAIHYIYKEKKRGGCIGCPHSKECGGKCSCKDL